MIHGLDIFISKKTNWIGLNECINKCTQTNSKLIQKYVGNVNFFKSFFLEETQLFFFLGFKGTNPFGQDCTLV